MPTKLESERRVTRRFRFSSIIRVHDGQKLHDCKIIDLSLYGFRARCPRGWLPQSGTQFAVQWRVADSIQLGLQAEVKRVKNGVIGCQWQPHDAESSAHLQRLVEISRLRKQQRERALEALRAGK
jgi:PilZ domain